MSRLTALLAGVLAMFATLTLPAGAGGGGSYVQIDVTCNTATGDYDVAFEVFNVSILPNDLVVDSYEIDGVAATPPTFAPDPPPAGGFSYASDTVPGTTTSIDIVVILDYGEIGLILSDTAMPPGDCQPAPTTTTTTTEPTTTTTTVTTTSVAAARAATPTFTG